MIKDTITEADTACWNWPLFPGVDNFEAIVSTNLDLSETSENLKFASAYGLSSKSRVVRLSSDINKRASVKFIFNPRKDNSKASNKDSLMVS